MRTAIARSQVPFVLVADPTFCWARSGSSIGFWSDLMGGWTRSGSSIGFV